ncbi:histidine phosphatase family protein [Paraglaciecola aquimarina]|uniref:Histidine phosphatase family protein n=1 Tax=Paraglaciecola aquimarina TaxID=1235557 RepID=A0ABU3T0R6_9ALTE|nr:histidine phosphatase family protein [Paraglaciecola aquimarina]MDU0355845.1 histidine phosphatase family protein [Paraglaciecola aquimarina]
MNKGTNTLSILHCAIIRHGNYQQLAHTPSALQPFPLNSQGKQQALAGAKELASLLDKHECMLAPQVDSSNLLRAWQTATIFIDELQQYFTSTPTLSGYDALAERSVGSAANLSIEQINAILAADPRFPAPPENWKSDSHYCLPLQGAESLLQAGQRVKQHLTDWANASAATTTSKTVKLFFGHGAAFRHGAHHLGLLPFDKIAALSMYHARPIMFKVEDGQFSHIDGSWKIRQATDIPID